MAENFIERASLLSRSLLTATIAEDDDLASALVLDEERPEVIAMALLATAGFAHGLLQVLADQAGHAPHEVYSEYMLSMEQE